MKLFEKYKKIATGIYPILVVVLLGIVLLNSIRYENSLKQMSNKLDYLMDNQSILQSEVVNLQSNIEATLEDESSPIESYAIEVTEFDFVNKLYTVKISVVPKEYTDSTKCSTFFGTKEVPLTLNRYTYEGSAQLSTDTNYDGNVTVLIANGDKKTTKVLDEYVGIQSQFENLLYGSIPKVPKYEFGRLYTSQKISYTLNDYQGAGYSSFELVVMADGEELDVINLMQESVSEEVEEPQTQDTETESLEEPTEVETEVETETTTEENETEVATEEDSTQNEDPVEAGKMVYGLSGDVMLNISHRLEEDTLVRIYLRAKNEMGFILEYDLFSATTQEDGLNGYAKTTDYFKPNYSIYDADGNKLEL